jgi:hypothetical protein
MNIIKQFLFINVIILILLSCKPNEENPSIQIKQNKNSVNFKKWLKDTLIILKKEKITDYKREIKVTDDLLSMDIIKSYNIEINPDKANHIKSKELLYALDLLKRNEELPKNKFNLQFVLGLYYSPAMIEKLKNEFDSEVKLFIISDKKSTIRYKFMKGNLIEKKVIK